MQTLRQRLIVFAIAFSQSSFCAALAAPAARTSKPVQTDVNFTAGVEEYNAQRYGSAAQYLQESIRLHPSNAQAHYYLANSLVRLQLFEQAPPEYLQALTLDPHGLIGSMSREALLRFGPPGATVPATAPVAAVQPASGSLATPGSGSPTSAPQPLSKAVSIIQQQAQAAVELRHTVGDQAYQRTIYEGELQAAKIQQHQAEKVSDMRNAVWVDKYGDTYPMYTPDQIDQTKQKYDEKIQNARLDAKDRAEDKLLHEANRAKQSQESAQNLQEQLTTKALPGSAQLLPEGTNFYVRNYQAEAGTASSPTVPGERLADQDKLILDPVAQPLKPHGKAAVPDKSKSQTAPNSSDHEQLDVHGQLVRQ